MSVPEVKPRRGAPILVRGMGVFLLLAALLFGLFWFSLHHYRDVAEWGTEGDSKQESLIYEGNVYFHAGKVGDSGIGNNNFTKGDALGEIKPEGKDAFRLSYPIHAVKTSGGKVRDGYLIVVAEDGESHVYYRQGIENPYRPPATRSEDSDGNAETEK